MLPDGVWKECSPEPFPDWPYLCGTQGHQDLDGRGDFLQWEQSVQKDSVTNSGHKKFAFEAGSRCVCMCVLGLELRAYTC